MAPNRRSWHPFALLSVLVLGWTQPAAARTLDLLAIPPGLAAGTPERVVTLVLPDGERAVGVSAPGTDLVCELLGNAHWRGTSLAVVRLTGARDAAGAIVLRTETQPAGAGEESAVRRLRPDAAQDARDAAAVRAAVLNPQDVGSFHPAPVRTAKPAPRGYRPASYPDLEGSPVRYLIITDAALAADFQVLADWKTRRGIPAQVRTVDWVLAHARRGSDTAETLRNFLKDAYALWGVDYVLLGGDTNLIPARFGSSNVPSPGATAPTDLYYACLDGSWNANRNGVWGEAAVSASNLGDQADLYADVYVARMPVRTAAEVQAVVQKTVRYETPVLANYQNDAVLLAEVLSPADYDSGQAITLDGAALSEQIRSADLPPTLAIARQYETFYSYPGSTSLTKPTALAALQAGANFVNHIGHGFRYNMSVGTASIVNAEADALTNGDRTFVLYLLNCTALAFDSNALGERFLLNANGGAVAVVGASREAYPAASIAYNQDFYDQLFALGKTAVGQAFADARLTHTPFTFFDTQDRWTHFIDNLLGDPALTVFTGPVQTAAVTHPAAVALGTPAVTVHVEAASLPVEGAAVCLWKGDESYATGTTDAGGDVTLALGADTAGTALVTVSQKNLGTYLGSITVGASAPAHLRVATTSVLDDGTAGTTGNGNGEIDAGETVRLEVGIANAGGASAAVRALLVSPHPQAVALEDSVELGSLAPSPTPTATASFLVQAGATITDQTTVAFTVNFRDPASLPLGSETVAKTIHAPRLEAVELTPSTVGSTTTFSFILKNFGTGASPGGTATLSTSDPDVTIAQGSAAFGAAGSFAAVVTAAPFEVTEATLAQRNRMHVDFVDAYGRTMPFDFDLRTPLAAARPVADASQGPTVMRLTWTPAADTDLLGYHVYRRPSGVGSLTRVTTDVVRQAYVLDSGLTPSTRYDWAVAAVDSSGLVGPISPSATASTNPPQLAGWPLLLPASTSSSVAIGDVDGDGDREIVVGDAGVYAWHHTGVELRDGDNDAATWGALTGDAATVTGAVALGEFDPARPGLEILRANWADSRVTVYDSQGNTLPGWPRQPANGAPGYWGTPTAADLDGDGRCEALVIGKDGRCYGWHHDGTPLVPGDGTLIASVGGFSRTSPTVVNLDGDPQLEIVVAGADGFLRAVNPNGSVVVTPNSGWPLALGGVSLSSPAVGDIDGNPRTTEIVVTSENDRVHVVNERGFELPGWPKTLAQDSPSFGPSPAVGDVNGDGRADIAVVSNRSPASLSTLTLYDGASGAVLLTKLLSNSSESSPILADVDGNGSVDVVVGGESGVINAWNLAGTQLDGFPLTVNDFVRGTPAFGDVDGDGGADLVLAGWDRNVYIWDLSAPYVASRAPWPMYCRDAGRTGNALEKLPSDTPVQPGTDAVPVFQALPNVPNPFNPTTRLRFELPAAGEVRVAVYDAHGRLVRELWRGVRPAGRQEIIWDGHDDAGHTAPTGVYWSRIEHGGLVRMRKLTLVK